MRASGATGEGFGASGATGKSSGASAATGGASARRPVALPDFPWDSLAAAKARAQAHPDGIVDLSVGTPVDDVAPLIQRALGAAANAPGYPTTHGTPELRAAVAGALARRYGIAGIDPTAVLPAIGTKELIASLPRLLGIGAGDLVMIPELAYPTYEVAARLAGAQFVRADGLTRAGPQTPALIFVNSPSNPTGRVLGVDHLRKMVAFARERGSIIVSDECYLGLAWDTGASVATGKAAGASAATGKAVQPRSILHPDVCDGDMTGLLAVHSLSKTSNLAGYRAGFVAGDPALVAELLEVRKHSGLMMPTPIQAAMTAALTDDEHERVQRERYRSRRTALLAAVRRAGFTVDHSEAGLYLWATRGEPCRVTVDRLADLGILVAPGDFYGPAGAEHVRIALTATDERIGRALTRL